MMKYTSLECRTAYSGNGNLKNPLVNQTTNFYKFETSLSKTKLKQKGLLLLFGTLIGIVNGLFGSGGGMLVVPVLSFVAKLEQKSAHATAIALILPLCVISTVVYAVSGNYQTDLLLSVVLGVSVGSIAGAFALKKLSNSVLTFVFYALMLVAGIKMIFQ